MGNDFVLSLSVIVGGLVGLALLLILRQVNCWYLKINERVMYEQTIILILVRVLKGKGMNTDDISKLLNDHIDNEDVKNILKNN